MQQVLVQTQRGNDTRADSIAPIKNSNWNGRNVARLQSEQCIRTEPASCCDVLMCYLRVVALVAIVTMIALVCFAAIALAAVV